jgi:glyoxylase-like metal-dependent hydrolase (beta-lactamase superfamily II)
VLRQVADGVLVHESEFCQSNAVVVQGRDGVLLIDAGVHADEMACLAKDLSDTGQAVVAGVSTHPHWDHLLWHAGLGAAPRYGTARCAATARDRLSGGIDARRLGIPEEVSLNLLGLITGLPAETAQIPWDGPGIRIIEHQAHAPGHAALLIEERGVLVAGDMLSDVLIPMLDLNGTADPIEDYLTALRFLEGVAGDVDVVVPGHGPVGGADQVHARIDQDRAYVHALRDGQDPSDPRVGPSAKPGWEWVSNVHTGQLQRLAQRSERDGTPSYRLVRPCRGGTPKAGRPAARFLVGLELSEGAGGHANFGQELPVEVGQVRVPDGRANRRDRPIRLLEQPAGVCDTQLLNHVAERQPARLLEVLGKGRLGHQRKTCRF